MAWSWSHTQEAYDNARVNAFNLSIEELATIYAEWKAYDKSVAEHDPVAAHHSIRVGPGVPKVDPYSIEADTDFDRDYFGSVLRSALKLPPDVVFGEVWERANDQRTCDNGGFNAWLCPYGCHTVPFDRA